jgi:hypothetical protein
MITSKQVQDACRGPITYSKSKIPRLPNTKIKDFLIWIWISGELLFVLKQRVSDWHNTITKEFGILKKLLIAVAMATMTSQHGEYFKFKVT